MSWETEFPLNDPPPLPLLRLLERGHGEDTSWNQDVAPTLGRLFGDDTWIRIMWHEKNPTDREDPTSKRFMVWTSNMEKLVNQVHIETDDVGAAIDAYQTAIEDFLKAKPQHWSPRGTYPGIHMGATQSDKPAREQEAWYAEFGPEYEPPTLLKQWAARTKLDDFSWHNDEAPKYAFDHDTGNLAFWFNMTEIANKRYGVVFYPEDGGYVDILQRTGDLDGAIAAFEEARGRIEDGEVFTEETHQHPPPPPPHEWTPRKRS